MTTIRTNTIFLVNVYIFPFGMEKFSLLLTSLDLVNLNVNCLTNHMRNHSITAVIPSFVINIIDVISTWLQCINIR